MGQIKGSQFKQADDVALGRWLGIAHYRGQAMTSWVLKSNGYVFAHSTVCPLIQEELHSETEKAARESFMVALYHTSVLLTQTTYILTWPMRLILWKNLSL
jgi:hypothetical protein